MRKSQQIKYSLGRLFRSCFVGLGVAGLLISLTASVQAATLYWVGSAGGNVNVAANWNTSAAACSGTGNASAAPGASDVATFVTNCTNNAAISASWSVQGLTISSGYTGTITQASSSTLTIGSSGFSQADGTFNGSSNGDAITVNGSFAQSNGSFRSTSGSLNIQFNMNLSGGSFTHNGGTVAFVDSGVNQHSTLTCSGNPFNLVSVTKDNGGSSFHIASGGSSCVVPAGANPSWVITGDSTWNGTVTVSSGTWTLTGWNVNITNNGSIQHSGTGWSWGGGLILGNSGSVTYSGTAMSVSRDLNVAQGTWPSGLDISFFDTSVNQHSTLTCSGNQFNSVSVTKDGGGSQFNIASGGSSCVVPAGANPSWVITGASTWNGTVTVSSGTWTLTGWNVDITNNGSIQHSGTGWSWGGGLILGNSGSVTYSGTAASFSGNLDIRNGTFPTGLSVTHFSTGVNQASTINCTGSPFGQVIINQTSAGSYVNIGSGCTVPLGASPTSLQQSNWTNNGTITVDSGTWTVNGSGDLTNNGTITHSGNGWISKGGLIMGSSGSVTYSGSALTFAGNFDIRNGSFPSGKDLTISGSGTNWATTVNCTGAPFNQVTINHTSDAGAGTSIGSGCTVPAGAAPTWYQQRNWTNDGTITVASGAWTVNGYGDLTNNGTITHSGNGWVSKGGLIMGASGSVSYSGSALTFGGNFDIRNGSFPSGKDLTISGSGTNWVTTINCTGSPFNKVVIDHTSDLGANTSIGSGCTVPFGAAPTTYQRGNWTNGGTITVDSGTWTVSGYGNLTNNGTITHSGSGWVANGGLINGASGAVTYNGAAASFMSAFDVANGTFPNGIAITMIDVNGCGYAPYLSTGSVTLGGLTVNTNWCSATLALNSSVTVTGDMTLLGVIANPGVARTLTVQGNLSQTGGTFGGANLTVSLEGTSASTISKTAGTFSSKLNVNKSGAGSASLSTALTTSGQTCTVQAGVFDINGQAFTCGSTFTVQNGGTLRLIGSESPTSPTLNSGSTVSYKGNGNSSPNSYSIKNWSYANLAVSMTDANDTLDATGLSPLTIPGNLTISNGIFSAPAALSIAGNYSNNGTFTHNNGTVTFNATDAGHTLSGSMTGGSSFYDLVFNGVNGAWSFGTSAAKAARDFTVTNGTVTAPSSTLTVSRNFTNNSVFAANGGTVSFDDNGQVSLLSYNAATTFSNLSVTTGGKTIKLDSGDQTNVSGVFTLTGADCSTSRVFLASDTPGQQAALNVTGSADVTRVDIRDSNAIVPLSASPATADSDNNTGWTVTLGSCEPPVVPTNDVVIDSDSVWSDVTFK